MTLCWTHWRRATTAGGQPGTALRSRTRPAAPAWTPRSLASTNRSAVVYGSPRVIADLHEAGERVSHTVATRMARLGTVGVNPQVVQGHDQLRGNFCTNVLAAEPLVVVPAELAVAPTPLAVVWHPSPAELAPEGQRPESPFLHLSYSIALALFEPRHSRHTTTPALDRRSLRWSGIPACTATPEDLPPSLAQHASCWRTSTSSSLHFQDTRRRQTSRSGP